MTRKEHELIERIIADLNALGEALHTRYDAHAEQWRESEKGEELLADIEHLEQAVYELEQLGEGQRIY